MKKSNFKTVKTLKKHLTNFEPHALSISLQQDSMNYINLVKEPSILYFENENRVALKFKLDPSQNTLYDFLRTDPNGLFAQKDEENWLVELSEPQFKLEDYEDGLALLTIDQDILTYYILLQPARKVGFAISYFEDLDKPTKEFVKLLNLGLLGKVQAYNMYQDSLVMSSYAPAGTDTVIYQDSKPELDKIDILSNNQGITVDPGSVTSMELDRLDLNTSQALSLVRYLYDINLVLDKLTIQITISTI